MCRTTRARREVFDTPHRRRVRIRVIQPAPLRDIELNGRRAPWRSAHADRAAIRLPLSGAARSARAGRAAAPSPLAGRPRDCHRRPRHAPRTCGSPADAGLPFMRRRGLEPPRGNPPTRPSTSSEASRCVRAVTCVHCVAVFETAASLRKHLERATVVSRMSRAGCHGRDVGHAGWPLGRGRAHGQPLVHVPSLPAECSQSRIAPIVFSIGRPGSPRSALTAARGGMTGIRPRPWAGRQKRAGRLGKCARGPTEGAGPARRHGPRQVAAWFRTGPERHVAF